MIRIHHLATFMLAGCAQPKPCTTWTSTDHWIGGGTAAYSLLSSDDTPLVEDGSVVGLPEIELEDCGRVEGACVLQDEVDGAFESWRLIVCDEPALEFGGCTADELCIQIGLPQSEGTGWVDVSLGPGFAVDTSDYSVDVSDAAAGQASAVIDVSEDPLAACEGEFAPFEATLEIAWDLDETVTTSRTTESGCY
jgi:hypothetical protein